MNTIYDGTFVLGQTSATNFVGGTGITVDSPSEGTVRISNDETVLWSGNATSAVNLSEALNNFERIKIEYGPDSPEWHEYKAGDSIKIHEMIKAGGTSATYWIGNVTLLFSGTNIRVMTAYCWDFKNTMSYNTAYNTYALNSIRKVVGVNRISGGNA